jgi:tetratricopeptide (TPR) repeat protein
MNPGADQPVLQRIEQLFARGQVDDAVLLAEQAVAAGNPSLPLHFRLAGAYLRAGRYAEALELTVRARALRPRAPGELIELAKRLMYFNQAAALRDVASGLLARPLWHAAAEADFAALLSMSGEQLLAAALLERAMAAGATTPASLYNRSQLHLYSGRMREAESDLQQCLRLEPAMAKAWWALSKLPRPAADERELQQMHMLASRVPSGSQDEVYLRFALFNRLDQLQRCDEAWGQLERGCLAKRKLLDYQPQAMPRFVAAAQAAFAADQPGPAPEPDAGPTPIFVVGMHRSGTTLLERILGNHSRVSEGGELYEFPAQLRWAIGRHFSGASDIAVLERMPTIDFAELGRRYLDQVRWRANGQDFLIDKLPSNFVNIGFIRRALPQAKVIHMRRAAMDTCFSNLKELFSNACPYSYDQVELADYYGHYRQLMAHWHAHAPGYVLDVCYEDLARDPEGEARRILAFCGLDWEAGCTDLGSNRRAVNTASSAQVREPIHQRGIGAWRRYEAKLQPLAERLAGL